MNQTQRHEKIVGLIKLHGFMSIDDLVSACEVTPQTIRRDLNQLAENGVVAAIMVVLALTEVGKTRHIRKGKPKTAKSKRKLLKQWLR